MRILYLLFVLFLSLSCSDNGNHTIKSIKIDPERSDSVALSKFVSNVDRVILETNDSSLITRISGIVSTNEFIFINDASNRVLQFDSTGKFIIQIGNQGRGPGEYTSIVSIAADPVNEILYINSYRQILCFDFSGNLLNVIKQEEMSEFITVIDKELWAVSTSLANKLENNSYVNITSLVRYNSQFSPTDTIIIKKVYLKSQAGTINPQSYFISDLGNNQYLYYPVMLAEPILRDTIYMISKSKLIPDLKLDFGKAAQIIDGKKQVFIRSIFLTKNYLFAEYSYNKNQFFFCYDFSNDVKYNAQQGYYDDFFNTGKVQLRPLDLKSGILFFSKDAFEVANQVNGLNEGSNPVIFITKLKND